MSVGGGRGRQAAQARGCAPLGHLAPASTAGDPSAGEDAPSAGAPRRGCWCLSADLAGFQVITGLQPLQPSGLQRLAGFQVITGITGLQPSGTSTTAASMAAS